MSDKKDFMMEMMPKMMERFPEMKSMCESMFSDTSTQDTKETHSDSSVSNNIFNSSPEIEALFEDWVHQIQDEIKDFRDQNKSATTKEIAEHFKLSEKSIGYFMDYASNKDKNTVDEVEYETLRIKKTNNSCSLCESYVKENISKPIVVLSCEGACLRGEISRRAANILCHEFLPNETVRLCLGSALTKDGGQRSLVRDAKRLIALEGCIVDCGSRLIKGVFDDLQPDVIRTDVLARFDCNLFGSNEITEEELNICARDVAKKIAEILVNQ